jgi:stearoyl-CoA desaturase (Delta-9 desaturase)
MSYAYSTAESEDEPPRGSAVVYNPYLVRTQKLYAAVTVVVPTIATAYAVFLAATEGVSGLDIGLFLVFYLLTLLGITVGFHRMLAHRAFLPSRAVNIAFSIFGSWCAQGPVLHWVSNHRRHHATSDRAGDPHSPNLSGGSLRGRIKGLYHAHIGSMFVDEVTNYATFGPDLMRNSDIIWINKHYLAILLSGLLLPAAIGGLVTQSLYGAWTALLWGGLVRMFVVHHAIWSITSVAHTVGARVFNSDDHSRNSQWLALLTGGEGWHNTHHAFPKSAFFATAPWQIDIGGIVVWGLEKIGAIREVHRITKERMVAKALPRR